MGLPGPLLLRTQPSRGPRLCAVAAGCPDSAPGPQTRRCQGRLLSVCGQRRAAGRVQGGEAGQPGLAAAVRSAHPRSGGQKPRSALAWRLWQAR